MQLGTRVMAELTKADYGPFTIYFAGTPVEPALLIDQLDSGALIENKGRGGIRIIRAAGFTLACRKYLHGGLLRAFTGDTFFSNRRALQEITLIMHLRDAGFPVIEPFAAIVRNNAFTKDLCLLTVFREGAFDLLDYLRDASKTARLRAIRYLAFLYRRLEELGVYHPDLHLNNVLVAPDGGMVFLDFDKSSIKALTKEDMARMFWRLNRFADKMEKNGRLTATLGEKAFFLRVYSRLSGYDMAAYMEKKAGTKSLSGRIGWFIENALYGARKAKGP
jgi:hypothetical protein